MAFVEAIVVLALLYFIGRSVYGKRTNRKFSLLSVLVDFFIIMVTNAVIMLLVLAVLALLIGGVGLMFGDSDEFFFVGVNERVATGQLLLLTLIVILATAILQFHLRKRLPSKVQTLLHMSDEDYVICEYYEAYSWGVGEDESGDGLYCGFEGVVGATVIGVQDTPGCEVRDDTFDEVADAVDGRVVSPVGVGEFAMGGFLHGGDHPQSNVAFVPNMTLTIEDCEESGFPDGLRIMHTTRQGRGDPGELSGQGAGHLQVHPRRVVLT